MDSKISSLSPSMRLRTGTAILSGAQVVDVKPVRSRLDAFSAAHRNYAKAQRKVEEIETQLRGKQTRLVHLDSDQDDAVERLARCLVTDGEPRSNPFVNFNSQAPSTIRILPPAEEAQAIHALVAALQRNKNLSAATLTAARNADKASQKVDAVVAQMNTLRDNAVRARRKRDVIAQTWDNTLSALRRGARSASDDGAPALYAALFNGTGRPPKKAKPAAQPPVSPTPTPEPAPAAT